MPRLPKDKVGFYVYLNRAVMDEFLNMIKAKYDKTWGALSIEVQEAIVSRISEYKSTVDAHTKTTHKINPPIPKSHLQAREIIDELQRMGYILQCSRKELRKAIEATRGTDLRTINKWMRFLVEHGYLKMMNPNIFEIL